MAKSEKTKSKHFRMIRIPEPLALRLEKLAEKQYSNSTEQAKQAILEYLEKKQA